MTSSSPTARGNPPLLPSAVVHIHRTHDILRDGAPPDGCVFIGPPHLPPAKQSLAWLKHHGYTVRLEYFSDAAAAVARYPQVSLDIGDHVREEGAAIIMAHDNSSNHFYAPLSKKSAAAAAAAASSVVSSRSVPSPPNYNDDYHGRSDVYYFPYPTHCNAPLRRSSTAAGSPTFTFSVPRNSSAPPPPTTQPQAWHRDDYDNKSNTCIPPPPPTTGRTSSLHWSSSTTAELEDFNENNKDDNRMDMELQSFSNRVEVVAGPMEDASSSTTPLAESTPMYHDQHNSRREELIISRSDFDALFRKTSMLHDRLDQILEQKQQQQQQQHSRARSSWSEFVGLISASEDDDDDDDNDDNNHDSEGNEKEMKKKNFTRTTRNQLLNNTNPNTRGSFYQDYLPDGTHAALRYDLPESTYSLLISEDIFSLPFNVGLLASALSLMCLILVLLDEFDKKAPGNTLGLPAGLHPSVQVAQYLGIIIGVLMENEIPNALELIGKGVEQEVTGGTNVRMRKIIFSCILRLALGYLFLLSLFLVVIQESTVLGIFFDVLALEFVENIDDAIFVLAKRGFFGRKLRVSTNTLPSIEIKKKIHALGRWTKRMIKIIYALNLCIGLVCLTYFATKQEDGSYRCSMVTVTFGDDMWQDAHVQHAGGLLEKRLLVYSHFNGVYEEDGEFDGRPRYVERNKLQGDPFQSVTPAEIVFCNELQSWVFRHEDIRTSNDINQENPCSWLFKSEISSSFDIVQLSKTTQWAAWNGVVETKKLLSIECNQCKDTSACNYHGECLEGKCMCHKGYFGVMCQFERPCKVIRSEKDDNTTLELLPYHNESVDDNNFHVSYGRPIYVIQNMNGMPYNFLRLGFTGDESYDIEYQNSSNVFDVGDVPPHKHIEPTFFDDDFFEQRFKLDKNDFKELMENYAFYLHFTGRRWYGDLSVPEMNSKIFFRGGEYHAFWDNALSGVGVEDNSTFVMSAPTNGISPVGVDFFEMRRRNVLFDDDVKEYDYDPLGVLIPLVPYEGNGFFHCNREQ